MPNQRDRFHEKPSYRPIAGVLVWLLFVTAIAVLYHDVNSERIPSHGDNSEWNGQAGKYEEDDDDFEMPHVLITPLRPSPDTTRILEPQNSKEGAHIEGKRSAAANS